MNQYSENMIKVNIDVEIPSGKLCYLYKENKGTVIECPFWKNNEYMFHSYCSLFKENLEGTENSDRKCQKCKEMTRKITKQ